MRREALIVWRRMVSEGIEMNSVIVTSVLPVIGEVLDRKLGREIHGYMVRRYPEFKKMMFVLSGLIDMYCKCGDMVSARHVFYGSTGRNVVSWTALISGYASNGRLEQALRSIVWMQHERIQPDVVTVATVLPICTQLKALKQGKEIHAYALKNWFIPNSSVETSLVNMYAECGKLDCSCRVFDGMRNKNVIAWTALIDSYIKNDHLIDALDVFRSMRLVHHNPDAVALGRVLSISGNLKALRTGKEIHAQVYKMKLESTPFLVGEIVKMYGKNGDTENARKVFDGVHSKGSLTCTAIIEAYGYNGRYREAIDLFDWMQSQGYVPNHFTFDAILGICERAGFAKEAVEVFDSMVKKYKLKATEGHCDSIIGLLTRTGRVMEAQRFIYLKSTLGQI
ncbi:uncharacterized protein A4U43_C09F3790 [Asparagus officinalis]|uniref:Pentacotripeptide-repeat region of PRORP domain-containing protein n=1 Tax=Asparagus officinalis TaxID=4686 RepID=A0A5P1E5E1_ASPOF|nr:pentatricopeptide repeat-containing protein At1g71460, chloroplastic [Asparagus officinalis]ONK57758.1 uncharacterized protein A4U43_C09F3790 [Asparagus officinalis]